MTMQHQRIRRRTKEAINLDHFRDRSLMLRAQTMTGSFKRSLPKRPPLYAVATTVVASVVVTPIIAALAP